MEIKSTASHIGNMKIKTVAILFVPSQKCSLQDLYRFVWSNLCFLAVRVSDRDEY